MTYDAYDRIAAANWSTLKALKKSPAHYRHRLLSPEPDTAPRRLGRAVHMAVLEPERFSGLHAVWPADEGRRFGKKWDAFRAAHAGLEILTEDEHAQCLALQTAVWANPIATRLLQGGRGEQTIQWTDAPTRIACKARLDYVGPSGLLDLKTTRDASVGGFARESWRYGYHEAAAWHVDGWAAGHDGEALPYHLIAVESAAPFAVTVFRVPDDVLESGRAAVRDVLNLLSFHRAHDTWPGYSEEVVQLQLPAWATGASDDEDEDTSGLDLVIGQ